MTRSRPGRTFRSLSASVVAVAAAALAAFLLGDAWLRAGAGEMLLLAPWVLAGLWGVYVFIYAPHVRIDEHGVRLHNILRVVDIPWSRVRDIAQRWQIEVTVDDGRVVTAFGGPAVGRVGRAPRRLPGADDPVDVLREQWQAHRGARTGDTEVTVRWDAASLISAAVIVVGAVIALLVAG